MKIALETVAAAACVAAVVFGALYFADERTTTVVVKPCGERTGTTFAPSGVRAAATCCSSISPFSTSGITANEAAAEDGAVDPGQPVPNDNYAVDESHRVLTYYVSPTAHVTVLANNTTGILSTPIGVPELAEIVANGKSSKHTLLEPLDSGVWIRVHVDTVCALDQQYKP